MVNILNWEHWFQLWTGFPKELNVWTRIKGTIPLRIVIILMTFRERVFVTLYEETCFNNSRLVSEYIYDFEN